MQVLDHGVQIQALELLSVIERLSHRIGHGRVLVQDLQVELVRPQARIRRGPSHRVSAGANLYRALGLGWIVGDSRRCRFEFILHLLILLRISPKNIASNYDPSTTRRLAQLGPDSRKLPANVLSEGLLLVQL